MRTNIIILALIGSLAAGAALARDDRKPSELYAEKEESFLRAISAEYVKAADSLRKEGLSQYARMLYGEAIEYFPNDKDARKALGFVRKGREWVLDPDEAKKLPESNSRPQGISEDLFKQLSKEKYDKLKEKADLYAGRKYAGLGKWCEKEGLADQAKKAYEKAVLLDSGNETARTGLGYEKVGDEWLTPKQIQARREAKEGKLVEDTSRFEGPLGIKLNKMESAHFRIETVFSVEALKDYVKNCETVYAYFLRDVGESEIKDVWEGRKAFALVLGSREQWHRYVDLFGGGDARQKEFTKQCSGSRGDPNLFGVQWEGEEGSHASTVDGLVHKTTHMLVYHYWKLTDQAWLHEGFAYYYTVKVLESTHQHCVALGDYNSPSGGMKDWGQSQNWKELVKKDVVTVADPDLRMFYGLQTKDLKYNSSVKAWSMISWLFDKHREKFIEWLKAVGHNGVDEEQAFKDVFGWDSFEAVDNAWREFVRENY